MGSQNKDRLYRQLALFRYTCVVTQRLLRLADAAFAEQGLTARHWLLIQLLKDDLSADCPTLTEVARCYGCSRPNVRRLAGELEARGYLDFVPDVDDLRLQRLRLTDKAKELETAANLRQLAKAFGPAFDHLDDDEIEAYSRRMELWARGLAADDRRRGDDGG
jgi:DNA-binding MarR family transcriptional regulator